MIRNGNAMAVHLGGEEEMLSEEEIKVLLEDIRTSYMVGYQNNDLNSEAEKWGQIQILEWILQHNSNTKQSQDLILDGVEMSITT